MRIRLRQRDRPGSRWVTLFDGDPGGAGGASAGPFTLDEGCELALTLTADELVSFAARVLVGDVLVASTLRKDRPDFLLEPLAAAEGSAAGFTCRGRLLRDWAGRAALRVEISDGSRWQTALAAELLVTAGKMAQEVFEALCAELTNHSAAALLDVYGKTFVGLEPECRPGEAAPVLALQRLHQALDHMSQALREIARQPAYRLKTFRLREPALAQQSVSDLTLEEACTDPTVAVRQAGAVWFRERVREVARSHFDLPEHRLISGFLHFLVVEAADLRARLRREVELREERRAYRHRPGPEGAKSWWETEDLPRITELHQLLTRLDALDRDLAQLRRHPFLPAAARLREVPPSSPLIRSHRAYAGAFKAIMAHFTAYRVRLDDGHLLARAKSLPVLYEWWCVLEVLRCLQAGLRLASGQPAHDSPFRLLGGERERLVIELAPDQAVDFRDECGRLVRLRYAPSYRPPGGSRGPSYGLLGPENERTPDVAIEVYDPDDRGGRPPDLIVVLDAKYSSAPHADKLDEVRWKYGKIGVFRTGTVLARQVWALAPTPAYGRGTPGPEWASFCTVDNRGFWSEAFDMGSTAAGVVQARPNMPAGRRPLDALVRLLLQRAGVVLRDG
jgi:hypothetical protein